MKYLLPRVALGAVLFGVAPAVLIFGLAGRWDIWYVWAYLGIAVVLLTFQALMLHRMNPDLLKEQVKPAGRDLSGRRLPLIGVNVTSYLALIAAGLDQRFHWSDVVPPAGVVAGLVIGTVGMGLFTWAMSVNRFFSSAARIQTDRGQRVIDNGPYAIVRHPGYLGRLLYHVVSGLALNSLLAFIPTVILVAFFARATAIEDQMLRDGLAGYTDYAAKVRYRLIPGIW